VVQLLLCSGAEVNALGEDDQTALDEIIDRSTLEEYVYDVVVRDAEAERERQPYPYSFEGVVPNYEDHDAWWNSVIEMKKKFVREDYAKKQQIIESWGGLRAADLPEDTKKAWLPLYDIGCPESLDSV
jgi:hypothetical protein